MITGEKSVDATRRCDLRRTLAPGNLFVAHVSGNYGVGIRPDLLNRGLQCPVVLREANRRVRNLVRIRGLTRSFEIMERESHEENVYQVVPDPKGGWIRTRQIKANELLDALRH